MEYTSAAVVLLGIICLLVVRAEEPVATSQVSDRSRYHQQVEFISNYLLQAANLSISAVNTSSATNDSSVRIQSPFVDKNGTSTKDNNTTPNEIQVIPVPAAVSSAIDTLPVHPRIPRRSSTRRSRNEHRHSRRVFQGQPVRFLLPPFKNEIFETVSLTTTSPQPTNSIFTTTEKEVSSTTQVANYEQLDENKLELKEFKQNPGPQHRRVFIPPPLRYLLPPFFYENYINAQSSTSPTVTQKSTEAFTLLTEDYYYTTNSSAYSQNISYESSSLAPIIVIETASQPDDTQDWNYPEEYSTAPTDLAYNEPEKETELRSSPNPVVHHIPSSTLAPLRYPEFFFKNPQQDDDYSDNNENRWSSPKSSLTSKLPQYSSTTAIPQTSESSGFVFGRYKTKIDNYASRSTASISSTTSTSTPYPFLRGPNIEQALFETGEFQAVIESADQNRSSNESGDPTLSMMDRPLLAQEVAQAGMKITAHMKKAKMNSNLKRGKSKYHHLNQFNFQTESDSRGTSKSLQLAVAESSYYDGRRASKQIAEEADIRAIPGRAGRDYPTFTKPPASDFSCNSVSYHRGYVADPSTGCQVFYICVGDGPGEPMLCPNGTIFSQDFLVCDWWYNVDCHRQT
ncbi:uncharacterized protein LOC128993371 [Macrosteles quadrilineatus]|uniref:uncharacterized protein LOC128993371 n=1 Tax=Macrosteles quadrilineatus TaxID=74068 RepID=UPI0023E28DCB|nr:uncharacterized protein LOC128993371 [Macrosteles quadrilineatus]